MSVWLGLPVEGVGELVISPWTSCTDCNLASASGVSSDNN